jgi:magnesium transporter
MHLIDYTDADYYEKKLATAGDCRPFLEKPTVTWIHVHGSVTGGALEEFGDMFGLHALALEDVLNTGQRPKLEDYDSQLFIVVNRPVLTDLTALTEQVSLFVGENFLVSFHAGVEDPFEPVRERLRNHVGRIRTRNSDYLLYALLDVIIDEGFPILEALGEEIEFLEEQLLDVAKRETLNRIHEIKREMLLLRRMLWPQREVLDLLVQAESDLIHGDARVYFRDCYDHTIQIMDLLETYRDMTASMVEVYLSSVSNRLNEVMRLLTVIATIFIPLTFIVGVYGMNFGQNSQSPWAMPELNWYYGYPLLWLVMIVIGGGMLVAFKRRGWW